MNRLVEKIYTFKPSSLFTSRQREYVRDRKGRFARVKAGKEIKTAKTEKQRIKFTYQGRKQKDIIL